jgi:nucleoside diphosphate-linked moiety X motif protein 19
MASTGGVKKLWRDSASMILFAKNTIDSVAAKIPPSSFDYELLMLRRSGKSKFMPNTYVYPGGVIAKSDFDSEWKNVFDKFGGGRSCDEIVAGPDVTRRPLLMRPRTDDDSGGLPRDAAFRLCAIRETFEESGIFFGCKMNEMKQSEVDEWRVRVHNEPTELLRMCHHFEVCPDIWSLYEWSCWLTPLFRGDPGYRRFDTIFYAAFLNSKPALAGSHDDKEMTAMQWTDPQRMLNDHWSGKLVLAPPQVYELTRMTSESEMSFLRLYCERVRGLGVNTWMPVQYPCTDGVITVLPGDELYPEEPDFYGEHDLPPPTLLKDMTVEEANAKYAKRNRNLIFLSRKINKSEINISRPMDVILREADYKVKL